jgi:hypothetical protein
MFKSSKRSILNSYQETMKIYISNFDWKWTKRYIPNSNRKGLKYISLIPIEILNYNRKKIERYILDSNWEKLKDTILTPIQKIMTLSVAMPCECSILIYAIARPLM